MAMMYGNRQNNQRDGKLDMNTRGIQMMNVEGFDPATLTVGSWNEMLSLRINPALDPSKRSEGRMFDYERNVSTSLNAENVMILLIKIKNTVLPAIEKGEEASVGLFMGNGASLLVVGTGKKLTNEIRPFLAIHKNLNENTRKPEMSMYYEFRRGDAIINYDEKTGNYDVMESVPAELHLFIKLLEAYLMHVGKFNVHFQRYVTKFYNDRLMNTVNAVADKVGASVNLAEGNKYAQRKNIFGSNSSTSNSYSDDADQETLSDISELANMLDQ